MKTLSFWQRIGLVATPAALFSFMSSKAQAQCVSCGGDQNVGTGYTESQGSLHCLPGQPQPPPNCIPTLAHGVSFLNTPHPGLLLTQHSGRIVVSTVIPGSPAYQQDIQVGDEIRMLNGKTFSAGNERIVWASDLNPAIAVLQIKRGSHVFDVRVGLTPLRTLLDAAWNRQFDTNAALEVSSNMASLKARMQTPFTVGARVQQRFDQIIVDSVLEGSPAFLKGIRRGDRLLTIDGNSVDKMSADSINAILNGYSKSAVDLTIADELRPRTIALERKGLTEILNTVSHDGEQRHKIELRSSTR